MARAKRKRTNNRSKSNGAGGRKIAPSARKKVAITGNDYDQLVALFQRKSIHKRYGPLFPIAYGIGKLTHRAIPIDLSLPHTDALIMQFNHSTRSNGNGVRQSVKTITRERYKIDSSDDDTTITETRITTTSESNGHDETRDIKLTLSMSNRANIIALLAEEQNRLQYGIWHSTVYAVKRLFNRIGACSMSSREIEHFLYSISN